LLANAFCASSAARIAWRGGELRCGTSNCNSTAWSYTVLARRLSEAQFTAYFEKLRALSENRVLVEQQRQHQAELMQLKRQLRGEMARDEEIAVHRRHITTALLCLRCPVASWCSSISPTRLR
jgi:hypothetical protein